MFDSDDDEIEELLEMLVMEEGVNTAELKAFRETLKENVAARLGRRKREADRQRGNAVRASGPPPQPPVANQVFLLTHSV